MSIISTKTLRSVGLVALLLTSVSACTATGSQNTAQATAPAQTGLVDDSLVSAQADRDNLNISNRADGL